MTEIPSSEWTAEPRERDAMLAEAPLNTDWQKLPGLVRHTFTHFHLELEVWRGKAGKRAAVEGIWCAPERLGEHALPTVMKKIVAHALPEEGPLFAATKGKRPASSRR